jgi:hypothetical protein
MEITNGNGKPYPELCGMMSSRECHCQAAGFLPQIYLKQKIQIFKKERVFSFFA